LTQVKKSTPEMIMQIIISYIEIRKICQLRILLADWRIIRSISCKSPRYFTHMRLHKIIAQHSNQDQFSLFIYPCFSRPRSFRNCICFSRWSCWRTLNGVYTSTNI